MSEGLSDRDRARIEAARQNAGGCLGIAIVTAFGFAAFFVVIAIVVMVIFPRNPVVFFIFGIVGFCCLVGCGFRWISKQ